MINQSSLGLYGEIGTLGTIQCPGRTTLLMTSMIKLCNLAATTLTKNFLMVIEVRPLRDTTEDSEINVKFAATCL